MYTPLKTPLSSAASIPHAMSGFPPSGLMFLSGTRTLPDLAGMKATAVTLATRAASAPPRTQSRQSGSAPTRAPPPARPPSPRTPPPPPPPSPPPNPASPPLDSLPQFHHWSPPVPHPAHAP